MQVWETLSNTSKTVIYITGFDTGGSYPSHATKQFKWSGGLGVKPKEKEDDMGLKSNSDSWDHIKRYISCITNSEGET